MLRYSRSKVGSTHTKALRHARLRVTFEAENSEPGDIIDVSSHESFGVSESHRTLTPRHLVQADLCATRTPSYKTGYHPRQASTTRERAAASLGPRTRGL